MDRLWEDQESVEEPTGTIILPPVDFYISESIRGVSGTLLEELGVYYCSHGRYKGRLVFPVKDTKGNLIGFDARTYEHHLRPDVVPEDSVKHAKYLRPTAMKTVNVLYPLDYLWNHRTELDLSTIVLVEGIFDAISYIQLGIPAVCNFGVSAPTPTKAGLILSLGVESIANGLDNDKAGVEGWQGTETKVSLKEAWRQYLPIAKPMALTKAIWASEFKDASEYLENFKVL